MAEHAHTIPQIKAMLEDRLEALCEALLPAGRIEGHEFVDARRPVGLGDSMRVELRGAKRGVWGHFAAGEAGDVLALISYVNETDASGAIRYAREFLGLAKADPAEAARRADAARARAAQRQREAEYERKRKLSECRHIWTAGQDIKGTPAEQYLIGRGIRPRELAHWPSVLRFHPSLYNAETRRHMPAMVALIAGEGKAQSVHRTYLAMADGQRWVKADDASLPAPLAKAKMVLGDYKTGTIRLSRGASGKSLSKAPADDLVLVSEGIEDGLSAALLLEGIGVRPRVLACVALPNLPSIWLPDQIKALTLLTQNEDNDRARKASALAIAALQARGLAVRTWTPPPAVKDINDSLRALGAPAEQEERVMRYRKKPVVIEAFRFGEDKWPEWFKSEMLAGRASVDIEGGLSPQFGRGVAYIDTLEGTMRAEAGDWIIQGVKGEVYPCKAEIFEATYEPAEAPAAAD